MFLPIFHFLSSYSSFSFSSLSSCLLYLSPPPPHPPPFLLFTLSPTHFAGVFGMSLDETVTAQYVYGPFEAVFVLTMLIIVAGIPLVLYYYESTGILPRVQRRRGAGQCLEAQHTGAEVMGMSTLLGR